MIAILKTRSREAVKNNSKRKRFFDDNRSFIKAKNNAAKTKE